MQTAAAQRPAHSKMSQDRVMRDAQNNDGVSKLNKSFNNNNNAKSSRTDDTRATAASIIFYGGDDENSNDGALDQVRITREVADEFTSDDDWRTIPRRLGRLIEILNEWVRTKMMLLLVCTVFLLWM